MSPPIRTMPIIRVRVKIRQTGRLIFSPDLETYVDDKSDLAAAFGIFSSPVTVLVSREGKEIGRIRGSADWDSSEVIEYMYKIKAEHG